MQVPVCLLVHAGKGPELDNTLCFTELRSNHYVNDWMRRSLSYRDQKNRESFLPFYELRHVKIRFLNI